MTRGNIMKTLLFSSFVLLASMVAHAADKINDPQFTFDMAAAAFNAATIPTEAELTGQWMRVGAAFNPANPQTMQSGAGYWPDGKVTEPGLSDFFRDLYDISFTSATVFQIKYSFVGLETGKVYESDSWNGVLEANKGCMYLVSKGSATSCLVVTQVKIDHSSGLLYESDVSMDDRLGCQKGVHR